MAFSNHKEVSGNSFDLDQYNREHNWDSPEKATAYGKDVMAVGSQIVLDINTVAYKYLVDFNVNTQIKLLNGPVGSGKTMMSALKIWWWGRFFAPVSIDGKHYVKAACFMRNKKECYDKAFQTFNHWFGKCGKLTNNIWNGALTIDNRIVVAEIHFGGPDDQKWSDFLQSFEANVIWFPETTTVDVSSPTPIYTALTRCRARPKVPYADEGFDENISKSKKKSDVYKKKPAIPGMIFGDYNAGTPLSFLKDWSMGSPPDGVAVYVQRGWKESRLTGEPMENLDNLPDNYYETMWHTFLSQREGRLLADQKINNLWVAGSEDSIPVFADTFRQDLSVIDLQDPQEFMHYPNSRLPLYIGIDPGLQYGVVVAQQNSGGTIIVYDELVNKERTNLYTLASTINALLSNKYRGFKVEAFIDPAATFANSYDKDNRKGIEILEEELGIDISPVGTGAGGHGLGNNVEERIAWVDNILKQFINGRPALLISSECTNLIHAMGSGYCITRRKKFGDTITSQDIESNNYTHVADALQYLIGGINRDGAQGRGKHQAPLNLETIKNKSNYDVGSFAKTHNIRQEQQQGVW